MIKVGEQVKIIDEGRIYSTFDKWILNVPYKFADTLDLWEYNKSPTKEDIERIWEVKYIASHTDYEEEFIALITDGQKAFAIGIDGLEVVHKVLKNHPTINNLNVLAKEVCEEYYQESNEHFSSELADIICRCLIIAGKEHIDIARAISDCLEKNRKTANGIGDKL